MRSFFTDERLRWLSDTQYWHIEAQGDLFVFDELKWRPSRRRQSSGRIDPARRRSQVTVEDRLADAERLFRVFC